ncbi:hypothetical protein EEQ99_02490 [Rhizobium anhuiense]|uniref:Uncharacterized protein n=1 Tax=Rhizobium anhuiense TaxID=1184720 RepID=A0A3S0QXH1_9HYPH|nr:hypothetical protein EEQ99_02490 [Rhizobium anhuiense]
MYLLGVSLSSLTDEQSSAGTEGSPQLDLKLNRTKAPKTKKPAAGEVRRAPGRIISVGRAFPRTGDQAARQEAGRLNAQSVRHHSADRVLSARTVPHRSKSALAFPAPAAGPASSR